MVEREGKAVKALSVQQPWAWLIVNGYKDIENRTWPTHVRGWVLVHAGKNLDAEAMEDMKSLEAYGVGFGVPEILETGGILGAMYIEDCVREYDSEWFEGPFGFRIKKAIPLPFIPLRGQLGFFDVSNALLPDNLADLLK